MKNKILLSVLSLCLIIGLTGCGSSNNAMSNGYGFAIDSAVAYSEDVDYRGNTYISGDLADYSYNVALDGNVKDKETVLDFYETLQTYVDENEGYIEEVYNDFSYTDTDSYYVSSTTIKNVATGNARFNIQVLNENVDAVLDLIDTFSTDNAFIVTDFTQRIVNYKNAEVVDDYEDRYEYWDDDIITERDLERNLKYTTINLTVYYKIHRNIPSQVVITVKSWLSNLWDAFGEIINVVFVIAILSYTGLFLIVLPIIKLFIKSLSKYYKKHPEYKRTIVVENKDKQDVTTVVTEDKIDKQE